MDILKGFFSSAIDLARQKGTEEQQGDIDSLVATTSHFAGELQVLSSRERERNKHHSIPDLTNAVIDGIQTITKVKSEINKNKTS